MEVSLQDPPYLLAMCSPSHIEAVGLRGQKNMAEGEAGPFLIMKDWPQS